MKRAAVAIMTRDGLILVGQRRHDARYALKWEFPGGKAEEGESVTDCLRREIREELGVTITGIGRCETESHRYPDGGEFEVHFCFVTTFLGEPVNHAFESIRWVSLAELKALDMLEGNRSFVARLDGSLFAPDARKGTV